jgi:hypothetical protein
MKNKPDFKTHLLIFFLFVVLSVVMLWPLPKFMPDRLISPVDPLLNSWIMAWDIHQLFRDPLHLFDANIFFPLTKTLAFSEHLIVLSFIAMPFIVVFENPILGYNFVQLLSFILGGFVVYLFVYHLTKNKLAGLIAGIIFAFHPYRFRQVGHIQNLAIFWTPLSLLYLYKFFKKPKTKYMLLFTMFFILQALSCGYLGVFLALVVILAVLYYLMFTPGKNVYPTLKKLVISGLISAVVIGPFLVPYFQVKKEHNFERPIWGNIRFSANILGYATVSRFNENVFYHPLSLRHRVLINRTDRGKLRPIGRGLFPGIVTLLLVLAAFLPHRFFSRSSQEKKPERKTVLMMGERIINGLILFLFLVAGGIIIFRLTHLTLLIYLIIGLFVVKLILKKYTLDDFESEKNQYLIHRNFYVFLAVISCFFSLGPKIHLITHDFGSGPYLLLYKYITFFKGIRVPERFGLLVMLALSFLAGYGMVRLLQLFKKRGKIILTSVLAAFLIYEFICVPLPSTKIPRKPGELYRWLAADKQQYGILEYPYDTQQANKYYMYWSTFHWKRLANGSTGFNSPLFQKLKGITPEPDSYPNREVIQYLKERIPVKYLILHLEDFPGDRKENILENASKFPADLKLFKVFEKKDYVYTILYEEE